MDNIKKNFKSPTSEYRSAPFWSWNDVMDGEELSRQLRDFKAHGIGGAFAHPRVGMVTEYLSEDFFKAWGDALETVKAEDMKLHMYDENAWPSLMAGGLVTELDPSTKIIHVKNRPVPAAEPGGFPGPILFAAPLVDGVYGEDLSAVPPEKWHEHTDGDVMVFYEYREASEMVPDVTNPHTTELFIKLTHEEYFKRFGEDFGTYIPSIFSDEVGFACTLPCSKYVYEKFRALAGYELLGKYFPIIKEDARGIDTDGRPYEKIRYDYFLTLHELWMENFVIPISKWCDEHGVAWTGHDHEHFWPRTFGGCTPGEMTTYEYRQWPGFDLLLCHHLRDTATNFDKFQMYEVRSAANQFSHPRTICEAYGAGGYHSTMYDYKRLGDYIMVGGINLLCQHLSLYSYLGSAKRDCPQSFDFRQPWWDEYTDMANYFARTSYILSQGKMEQRILLLNPYTASYTVAGEAQCGSIDHALSVDCVKNPDMTDFLTAVSDLTDEQWEFDLADEFSMSRRASVDGKLFRVGDATYDTVVVSRNMTDMRRSTVRLLCEFAAAGGRIVLTDAARDSVAARIEGETGCPETELVRALGETVDGAGALCAYFEKLYERRISSSAPWRTGIQHLRRVLDDGRVVYFIVNHSLGDRFETTLTLRGEDACLWDLYTGDTVGLPYTNNGDGTVSFPLTLERCGAVLIVIGDGAESTAPRAAATRPVALSRESIVSESENVFNIDHVSLRCDEVDTSLKYYLDARIKLFRSKGVGNPWSGIQRRTQWLDENARFDESSAFSVVYPFTVKEGTLPTRMTAVVERPELWHVSINGTELEPFGADRLDRGMADFDITDFVREGENEIVLHADVFNVLCEVEPVLIRGDFAVVRDGARFAIAPKMSEKMGDFADFGRIFYDGAVKYTYKATLESVPETARLELGDFDATVVSASVNGSYAGFVGMEGGRFLDIAKYLREGENEITLRVCASLRNLYGPHVEYKDHSPYEWFFTPDHEYTADEYEFSRYGLFDDPTLTVSE